ncbi:MAG TPA: hypothetical protein VM431_01285 [Phycisphaerae bacterium]|nr:hypothetical protein [Phycisphaerae bacterium]
MSTKAEIKYVGEIRDLVSKINTLENANRKLSKGLQEVKTSGKAAGDQTAASFGGAAASVGKMALAFAGVNSAASILHKAMSLITAEFDNIRKRRAEAAGVMGTVATERAIALKNVPTGQEALVNRIVEEAATRKALPLGRAAGYQLAGSVFSGASGLTLQQKEAVFKEAAKEAALTKQPEVAFAGTLTDIMKVIPQLKGHKDPQEAAQIAAGILEEFSKAARPVERDAQATLLRRLAASAIGSGTSFEKTFELGAAISQGGGDVEGNITATVVGRLFKNLRKARTKGYPIGGGQFLKVTGRGDEGLNELMDKVSKLTPAQKDVFFQSFALGRSNIGFAVADIIGRTERGQALLGAAEAEIGPVGEAGVSRRARLESAQAGKYGLIAKVERVMDAAIETQRISDLSPALAGLLQTKLPELMRAYDLPKLAQQVEEWKMLGPSTKALPLTMKKVESIAETLEKPYGPAEDPEWYSEGALQTKSEERMGKDARRAAGLHLILDVMQEVKEELYRLGKSNSQVEGN